MPNENEDVLKRWKCTVIAFWFLGLCNNLGYVVMLSGAHDILANFDESRDPSFRRECNELGTGVILLANILPAILIKLVAPFLPLRIQLRMACVVVLSALGFLLVGIQTSGWLVVLGVVSTSLSSGLGESTVLGYLVFFRTYNVISTWSSGTGGAGIIGAGLYAFFTSAIRLSTKVTILIMLFVPLLQAISFFFFIDHPRVSILAEASDDFLPIVTDQMNLDEKIKIIPSLLKRYMAPFGLVYLFEYFINQALFELVYIPRTFLGHHEQYRTYQFLYQTGVFISRSSMNILKINYLWVMAMLQLVNVVVFMAEVYFGYIYYLVIIFILILWEGLLGGATYVNTYRRIAQEFLPKEKQFCMAMNGIADALMISMAGIIAVPVHNSLCNLEKTY